MKEKKFVLFSFILFLSFVLLFLFGLKYYEAYQSKQIERIRLHEWGKRVSGSLTASQKVTYENNKEAIDTFIDKLDEELRLWMKYVTIISLNDLNTYLKTNNRSSIILGDIALVDNNVLLDMLKNPHPNRVILDIRDDYEREFVQLGGVRGVRLGDLVNNEFSGLPKDTEIIVLCHTDARSFVAANYLISQGFTNVKAYKGGVIAWLAHNNPVITNKRFEFIYDVLPYLTQEEVNDLKKNDRTVEEIMFASYSTSDQAVQSLLMSSKALDKLIAQLSPDKKYIIRCTDHHHCFDAVSFWDKAKEKQITFLGYTGYVFK